MINKKEGSLNSNSTLSSTRVEINYKIKWRWNLCGKIHTPLRMGRVRVIISCQKWVKLFLFWPSAPALLATFPTNKVLREHSLCLERCTIYSKGHLMQPKKKDVEKIFSPFCSVSPEIIWVKVDHRQTDKFFDTINGICGFFLSVKFATSLLASLAGG